MKISQSIIDCIQRQNDAHANMCDLAIEIMQHENDIFSLKKDIAAHELSVVAGMVGPSNDWKSLGSNDAARKHAIEVAQSTHDPLRQIVDALRTAEINVNGLRADFDNLKRLHAAMSGQQQSLVALMNAVGDIELPTFHTAPDAESPSESDFTSLGI